MENDWKKILVSPDSIRVEILKQMLEENGIKSVVINKQDSSYRFGNIELYVHQDQEQLATQLINDVKFDENSLEEGSED